MKANAIAHGKATVTGVMRDKNGRIYPRWEIERRLWERGKIKAGIIKRLEWRIREWLKAL
jgi:hypothetical protein